MRSDIERENNWMSLGGLTVDESYWFKVTARDAEGKQSSSEPQIFALRMRTGKWYVVDIVYTSVFWLHHVTVM